MANERITRDTELRKLPYAQLYHIASKMNHSKKDWQTLMMLIPRDLANDTNTQEGRFKYTQEHMRMIEEASSTGRLPAHILFEEWGTSGKVRPTVEHLLNLLVQANLYRAADYLAVEVLKEDPPPRPVSGPAAPIDINSLLDGGSQDVINFNSHSITLNETSPQRVVDHSVVANRTVAGGGGGGDLPVISGLFPPSGLVSVEEDENSNAPTLSTNLESDPGIEELSGTLSIPNISMLMRVASAEQRSESTALDDLIDSQASIYQSNLPNMSLFGGQPLITTNSTSTMESTEQNASSPSSTNTPGSSASASIHSQSSASYFGSSDVNHSIPQLSFLMDNLQVSGGGGGGGGVGTITSATLVENFPLHQLHTSTAGFAADRLVGAGAFGSVYLALNLSANLPQAAVKRLNRNFEQVKEKFDLEVKILSEHSHENLVRLLGYADDGNDARELCLVYEFVDGGNLERRLEMCRRGEASLSVDRRLSVALGVGRGIEYLHSANLIHRDVKSANVLLTHTDVPKLCDFGLLRTLNSRTTTMAVGSSGYMAPEIVRGTYDYEKTDVFAFGVLQLELLSGLPVVCAERREDLVTYAEKVVVGNHGDATALLDKAAGDWKDLGQRWYSEIIEKALELSPNKRCNIYECLQRLSGLVQ